MEGSNSKREMRLSGNWIGLAFGAIVLLVGVPLLVAKLARAPTYTIAYLGREERPDTPAAIKQRTEQFDLLHRLAIQKLIDDHNDSGKGPRLRLASPLPPPRPEELSDYGKFQASRYKKLLEEPSLVCVFDNSWGGEIQKIQSEIMAFPVPIVFLNADKNRHDYGNARLFVGSCDMVPSEILTLLKAQSESTADRPDDVLLVREADYHLAELYITGLRDGDWGCINILEPVSLSGLIPSDRGAITQARASIVSRFMSQPKPTWERMQARKKTIILSVHSRWGDSLIQWLHDTFENLTIIGHQSITRDNLDEILQPETKNEIILLTSSDQNIPQTTHLLLRDMRRRNPEEFSRGDAALYVRRCEIAMASVLHALEYAEASGTKGSKHLKGRISRSFPAIYGKSLSSGSGSVTISPEGETVGQNHFLVIKNGDRLTYRRQFAATGTAQNNRSVIPNIHCGIQRIDMTDLDLRDNTIAVDAEYWLVEASRPSDDSDYDQGGRGLIPVNFKTNSPAEPTYGARGQRLVSSSRMKDGLGLNAYQLSGKFGGSFDAFWYPFDTQSVVIELQAPEVDEKVRLSHHTSTPPAITLSGWNISGQVVTLNSRETSPIKLALPNWVDSSTQHDTIKVYIKASRKLASSVLLILCPLFLLVLASNAILFIQFGEAKGANPARMEEREFEALKTQTELSITCVLALVAYLIPYAELTPRPSILIFSDILVAVSLLLATLNFAFIVAIRNRESNCIFKWLSPRRYRLIAAWAFVGSFSTWVVIGLGQSRLLLF